MSAKTILLVDDNQDDVDLTLRALRKSKVANEVVVARNGVEALDYLHGTGAHTGRDTSIQPQVILMDLKMPKMGGLEALQRLRADARTQNVPVVILTTSQEESDLIASYDRGANSFVRKPVDFVQFAEAVQHLNLYWLVMNEVAPVTAQSKEKNHE
jgi:two-component system response regulator